MKIEKVSENKIKVTISMDDLHSRNLDLKALNYDSPAAQELFLDMMEQAEQELGFSTSDSQLMIEAMPGSEDNFIITISKLDEESDFESMQKYIKDKYRKKDLRAKGRNRKICSAMLIYSFSSFDDVVELAKRIHPSYGGDSTLYKLKETYYLMLTKSNVTQSSSRMFDAVMGEYGGRKIINPNFYEGYLSEYGVQLMDGNAIEDLNRYF